MKQFSALRMLTVILFATAVALFAVPAIGTEAAILVDAGFIVTSFLPMPAGVLGLNNTNNQSARDSFLHAKKMFFKAFRDKFAGGAGGDKDCSAFVDSLKLSQSEIRLEVELNAANNIFSFGVTPNQANSTNVQFNTENRLNLQDSLVIQEYGIFVGNPASRVDTRWNLKTYGNTQDFAAGVAVALDTTFFSHGKYLIKCNNDVIMPYRGLFNHLYRGQTQQTAALGAASPGDQLRGAEDGVITSEPNIVLVGSKNYQPQIELPTAMVLAGASTFERAVIIYRGVLAQNSTVVS